MTKTRLCASSYPTNGIEILLIHHSQSYLNKVVSFYFLNNAVVYWTVFTLRSLQRLHFWIGFYYQIQFMSASNGIVLHMMSYWNRVFMKCIQRVMFVIQYTCNHIHNIKGAEECLNMHFFWRNGNEKWNIFPLLYFSFDTAYVIQLTIQCFFCLQWQSNEYSQSEWHTRIAKRFLYHPISFSLNASIECD